MIDCDMHQMEPVSRLLQAVPDRRDGRWKKDFLAAVVTASFACGSPQVLIGPDGFSYFGLYSPKPNQPFNAYCICNLTEPLTEQGIGVSINPDSARVDWVFTAGDLLAYRLYGSFETPPNGGTTTSPRDQTLERSEQVLISAPSESFLPRYTRRVIRRFIEERLGIRDPGVFLLNRAHGEPSQQLVFSIYREYFSDDTAYRSALSAITWFLPRHYSVIAVPRDADWERHLTPL